MTTENGAVRFGSRAGARGVHGLWGVILVAATGIGCAIEPLGAEGTSCAQGPCAAGLLCVDGRCTNPPEEQSPAECVEDAECVWKGSVDGRACEDGVCAFAACTFDVECGARICDAGRCAEPVVCLDARECSDAQVCTDGLCRTPCAADEECPVFGGFLQACVDGACTQRCFTDLVCFGQICEDNLCVEPACVDDADCADQGDFFCADGRCEAFTPCAVDEDCFDPDYACSELGRCVERPLCRVDTECGAGLCINRHCRDAARCADDGACGSDEECIAGRCVDAPACRSSESCTGGAACVAGRCADAARGDVTLVEVEVQARVAFVGDAIDVAAQAFGVDGAPVRADYAWTGAEGAGPRARVRCTAPGPLEPSVTAVGNADVAVTVGLGTVDCVEPAGALAVLVLDGDTGAPVTGAVVFQGDLELGVTDGQGFAALEGFAGGDVGVRSADGRGAAVIDAALGRLYLALPPSPPVVDAAAGVRARVIGDGDEDDAVGLSLALPPVARARAATLDALLGAPFGAELSVPVLGGVSVELPAGVMLDVNFPVLGLQEVKDVAWVRAPSGPTSLLAFEARYPQGLAIDIALAADPLEVALDMIAGAEGMDASLAGAGVLSALPLVEDGDLADGVDDVDGDGDVAEQVPDWYAFPSVELVPAFPPAERVGVRVTPPPQGANPRMFTVCGVETPARFLPLGVGALFGAPEDGASSSSSEQLKVVSAPPALDGHPRTCAVHALATADAVRSVALARANAFGPLLDVGALLEPPAGSLVLEGVPDPERATLIVPAVMGADALTIDLVDVDGTAWTVTSRVRGSVPLPAWLAPAGIVEVRALRLGQDLAQVLASVPARALEDSAQAIAAAR